MDAETQHQGRRRERTEGDVVTSIDRSAEVDVLVGLDVLYAVLRDRTLSQAPAKQLAA